MALITPLDEYRGDESFGGTARWERVKLFAIPPGPRPAAILDALYDYEDSGAAEGAAVLDGVNGVDKVNGAPVYRRIAGLHGTWGWEQTDATGGATLRYLDSNTASMGSLYAMVTATDHSGPSRLIRWQNGNGTAICSVYLSSGGGFSVERNDGSLKLSPTVEWTVGKWFRIDWQKVFAASNIHLVVRFFTLDSEKTTLDSQVTLDTPFILQPNKILLGSEGHGVKVEYDSTRIFEYNTPSVWPSPIGDPAKPIYPAGSMIMCGDLKQTTALLSSYNQPGTVFKVGYRYGTASDLSGATIIAADLPDVDGWRKFPELTGLTTDTQYYYQQTHEDSGGTVTNVGLIQSFWTLLTEGIQFSAPYKITFGSCKGNGTSSNNVPNDIVSFAPHHNFFLGDLGYPILQADPIPHKNNWASNWVDPAVQKVMKICNWFYFPDDHDVNGGGKGNNPNFQDPATRTNISVWKSIMPAYIADTEDITSGRWRSFVHGPLKIILLDQRNLFRTNTWRTPYDPTTPNTSWDMLGQVQLNWLYAELDDAAMNGYLVNLFTGTVWNGISPQDKRGEVDISYSDKWPTYVYQRELISQKAWDTVGPNMIIFEGDSHATGIDDGHERRDDAGVLLSETHGYMTILSSGWDRPPHAHYWDNHEFMWPPEANEDGNSPSIQGYQRLTYTPLDATHLQVTVNTRDCTPRHTSIIPGGVIPGEPWAPIVKTYQVLS